METLNLIMERTSTLYNEKNPKDLIYEETIVEMISNGKIKSNFRESIFYMPNKGNTDSTPNYSCDCDVYFKLNDKCCESIEDFVKCPHFKFYILYYPLFMIYHNLNVSYLMITEDILKYLKNLNLPINVFMIIHNNL